MPHVLALDVNETVRDLACWTRCRHTPTRRRRSDLLEVAEQVTEGDLDARRT